ncbi:hypothetical protein Cni_G09563 [Canna indica]|uniref:FAF domain-containing protein n=1 Tax=Canna indica TaxID=4628 RepID=A0AAQ3K2K5_9LILI|nr:hypothetical protein Cni_G09563 [Canna indica]
MAAWGGLSSLFEQPMPKNPTLIESLSSWNQIMPKKPDDATCFTEIFGELHFKEKPSSSSPLAPPPPPPASSPTLKSAAPSSPSFDLSDLAEKESGNGSKASLTSLLGPDKSEHVPDARSKAAKSGFPAKNSDKLHLCTERLGSESSDGVGVDDLVKEVGESDGDQGMMMKIKIQAESYTLFDGDNGYARSCSDVRTKTGGFPPPISSIGRSGKPWIYFKSCREDGRFVLREIRIPTQEFLHASREDGRLKLQLVHPDEDISKGDEDNEETEEEEKGISACNNNKIDSHKNLVGMFSEWVETDLGDDRFIIDESLVINEDVSVLVWLDGAPRLSRVLS